MSPALQGLITVAVGVSACVGYFFLSNMVLDKVFFPPRGPNAGRNINRANLIRPWLFLLPAMLAAGGSTAGVPNNGALGGNDDESNPRLRAETRTDAAGRYAFRTIRRAPGSR